MKLQIKTTFDFGKLASKTQGIVDDLMQKTIVGESTAMKNRISKGNTITGKMEALKDSTKETRKLRGISGTIPLNATGALLNSINSTPKGIKGKSYGSYHNTGFVTQNKPIIDSKMFNFAGKSIPARQWLHNTETFKNDKKLISKFYKSIFKALKK